MTDGLSVVVARLCHRCNLGQRGPGRSPGNASGGKDLGSMHLMSTGIKKT